MRPGGEALEPRETLVRENPALPTGPSRTTDQITLSIITQIRRSGSFRQNRRRNNRERAEHRSFCESKARHAFASAQNGSRPLAKPHRSAAEIRRRLRRRQANEQQTANSSPSKRFVPTSSRGAFQFRKKSKIIHEDDDFIAIDKPSGLPTHPTLDNYLENALRVMESANQPAALRHASARYRNARTSSAREVRGGASAESTRLFELRRVKKIYRALTKTPPPIGRHEHFMQLDPQPPKPVSLEQTEGSSDAILTVQKVWQTGECLRELKLNLRPDERIRFARNCLF